MTLKSKPTMRPSERYRGRVEFLEVREEVFELAAKGYSRLTIYRHMFERKRFTMSYRCFCNYFERETIGQSENISLESPSRQQVEHADLKNKSRKMVHENKLSGNQSYIPGKENQPLLNLNEGNKHNNQGNKKNFLIDVTKGFFPADFVKLNKPKKGKYLDLSGDSAQVISESTDSDT